ncbi:ferric-dicitrate binding protein FerR (iron transport regulator) [Chitinophaga terrae (ex Kim and Jung 2007)]|uniref:FecR family protein n=1 Tax=Chitinophaga terrae (ex Kim and Jung 2007) TaxID=408074 RepID=UPI0027854E12|nr:FecR family protein [Chitinophaga terrae (ex Kim and Jung 2007)]MDQ0110442.1 ferric-dicitrate binding protein FerR (iron transport regulator) [Chitinophaga terrae (ex Kim and Jung 2007)]
MTKEEFQQLYIKFQEGKCSPEELKALFEYQDGMQMEDGQWDSALGNKWVIAEGLKQRLNNSMEKAPVTGLRWKKYAWRAAAAAAALLVGVGAWDFYRAKPIRGHVVASKQSPKPSGVSLVLGSGKTISLSDAGKGVVNYASGVAANKVSNAELAYDTKEVNSRQPAEMNTLKTPPGFQYTVTLSDGSKVRLNASSSLQYPVYFTGKQREVTLTGEAFFEVSASAESPFIVHVKDQKIQALGTMFNIKAYQGENTTKTTLVNGAVNVHVANTSRVLPVGQQLQFNTLTNEVKIREVNMETVLAWKDGIFAFEREPIADIMMEIGRWYNMDIVFAQGDKNKKFTGTISRYDKIEDVLLKLEKTGAMKFHLENKKVIVQIP